MIVFDLHCGQDHVFEAWFGSSRDYESQSARGLVACPICGDGEVRKAAMAPAVPAKTNQRSQASDGPQDPATIKAQMAALAALQARLEANSDYVGDRLPDEARAIHLGDAPLRAIHGEATPEQASALIDEGISLLPLPFRPRARGDA